MSGGSLNYLYSKTAMGEIAENVDDIEQVECEMLKRGYKDIAMDARRLIEYIRSAENRIECLAEKLGPVFKAVEWYYSADSGEERIDDAVERYRKAKI